MKKVLLFLLLITLLGCSSDKDKVGDLTHYLPEEASFIIRSTNFSTLSSDIENNAFLSVFSKMPFYTYFEDHLAFSSYLNPVSEVLISSVSENDSTHHYTLTIRQHPDLFALDSIQDKTVETLSYEDISLQRITLESGIVFTTMVDSVFMASSSQKVLESILLKRKNKNLKPINASFEKAYSTLGTQETSLLLNGKKLTETFQNLLPEAEKLPEFASWISLDSEIQPGHIKVNGIALAQDSIPQLLNVFRGTNPQKNLLAMVTPTSASGLVSYTYDDYDIIEKNLKPFRKQYDSLTTPRMLFASLNEIGVISTTTEKIIALHAIDGIITDELLEPHTENQGEFREIPIKRLKDSTLFKNAFEPLITTTPKYGAQINEFFVFAEKVETLEEIITQSLNETTLGHLPYYEEHMAQLSSESSILFIALLPNMKDSAATKVSSENQQKTRDLQFGSHRLAALQFVYDNNFAHVNGITRESQSQSRSTGVSQVFAINLENELLSRPQFFTNHITKGKDIVVQDVANKLYLISANGKVLWSKQLESAILGDVQEVDLLKNGKYQLAFTTKNNFYVLDRNGKEVAPFPLKFRDDITQPLAVFDYDNKRDYRFVITQGSEVLMYDNKGKSVSGFTFKKAGSKVVLPPKHIRISNKDYILIAEENGKLNILHRTGQSRVGVSSKFDFGESQIYTEDNAFVFLTSKDEKISIDQNGKVSTQNLSSSSKNVVWEISRNTKATLDDNILRINNQKVELPFGLYTAPKISFSNRRILVSITDLQQQRTYVYNSLGELLSNFPVYGTSIMELGDATNNGRPNGVVKGASKEVVMYEIN
tara:strand:+ start:42779 stop:45250 length:2472 start_codon:yes stop_codon:yes gene_type:complete